MPRHSIMLDERGAAWLLKSEVLRKWLAFATLEAALERARDLAGPGDVIEVQAPGRALYHREIIGEEEDPC